MSDNSKFDKDKLWSSVASDHKTNPTTVPADAEAPGNFESNHHSAMGWDADGVTVIPVPPGTKRAAVPLDKWIETYSSKQLSQHFRRNPDHLVGTFLGNLVVFEANTPESKIALAALELKQSLKPGLVIKSPAGGRQHFYFKPDPSTCVVSDPLNGEQHPGHIGVMTGEELLLLPPRSVNTVILDGIKHIWELDSVSQADIDAVFVNNGKTPPRPAACKSSTANLAVSSATDVSTIDAVVAEDLVVSAPRPAAIKHAVNNALEKYVLNGQLLEIESMVVNQVLVLGNLALKGQATALYAQPNMGKTLLSLALLIEAIKTGKVDPALVYFANYDDTTLGVADKLRIAEEYGFKMLAESHKDFQAGDLQTILSHMVENDHARDVIVIVDTLTKIVNVMDATKTRALTKVIRKFILKGGTLIALAHTNKNPGADGKPVYRGTTDIINDFDCVYVLSQLQTSTGEKVVLFENMKRRGSVALSAAYSYSTESDISYQELIASVQEVDESTVDQFKQAEEIKSDAELIAAVIVSIDAGVNTKMRMADYVAEHARISKRAAMKIIDKYTGDDPAFHRWNYSVGERGAKIFFVLEAVLPVATPEHPPRQ